MKEDVNYSIYILFKNGLAVYVGCSSNVKSRIYAHKSGKINFDSYCVFKDFTNKSHALQFERWLIVSLDFFGNVKLENVDATSKIGHINKPELIKI